MATAVQPTTDIAKTTAEQLPAIAKPRLPYHPLMEERFGIDRASWKALVEAIFPGAQSVESVILALSYCRARKLDPFKRCVHIVPIWNKEAGCLVDTVWPGIGELRTTAFRTKEYAGRGATEFGPLLTQKVGSKEISFPEWAQVSVFRIIQGQRVEFCGPRVYWLETYAVYKRSDDTPNEMWASRPRGQIDKCAEAAALRCAFPEEIGSDYIPEEIEHNNRSGESLPQGSAVGRIGTSRSLDELSGRLSQRNGVIDAEQSEPVGIGPIADALGPKDEPEEAEEPSEAETDPTDAPPPDDADMLLPLKVFTANVNSMRSHDEIKYELAVFTAQKGNTSEMIEEAKGIAARAIERLKEKAGAKK